MKSTLGESSSVAASATVESHDARAARATDARVAVVVLGDLGRSPRMLLQAISLADLSAVDLVGGSGAELPAAVRDRSRLSVHRIAAEPPLPAGRRVWIAGAGRLWRETWRLSRLLLALPRPDLLLVQNPPSLPALAVVWLVARLRGSRWIVDWHNFGFSVLALKLGEEHRATRLLRWCETELGGHADAHLCVSAALRDALADRFGIGPAQVLYDRPLRVAPARTREDCGDRLEAILTELGRGPADRTGLAPAVARPAVLVSPTSWTLDEDFDLLLAGLDRCQASIVAERAAAGALFPRIVVVITGRGPLRAAFEARLDAKRWPDIEVRTGWLAPERYSELLESADLGLCLHRSSSGLDLPMKIADMLGAGLPVAALDYGSVLAERFRPGEHGVTFTDANHLGETLASLLRDFPQPSSRLETLRRSLQERPVESWAEGWAREARPVLAGLLPQTKDGHA